MKLGRRWILEGECATIEFTYRNGLERHKQIKQKILHQPNQIIFILIPE
jgi:hypothetical protein